MPVKPETVVAYLGLDIEKIEDEKAMKAAFDAAFLRRDIAHDDQTVRDRVFGKINAIARQRLKSGAKTIGVDIGNVDEGDPVDLIVKFNESVSAKIGDIAKERDAFREAAEKGGNTEALTKLQQERDALIKERDAIGAQAKEFERKYTDLNGTWTKKQEEAKRTTVVEAARSRIKFRDDVHEYAKKGFLSDFFERHTLDLSGDQPKVLDASGAIIMDKAKAQTFASLDDLLIEAADAAKLTPKAPQAGTPARKTVASVSAAPAPDPAHPGARRTREVMRRF
jgi:hypothetical protein